jgi:hypothetical protein
VAAIEPNVPGLLVFGAAFAVCCLGFLTIAGMFPLRARPAALAGMPAIAMILANLALMVLLALATLTFAHQSLRWSSAVVLGGLIFLFAPSAFQAMPDEWRDSRFGLALLGVIQVVTLVAIAPPLHVFAAS